MNELMQHVERIVRSIRATQRRKLRMRQELLLHLQSAVQMKVEQGSDESAAVSLAISRLGDPATLTKQLQDSVPALDRVLLWNIPVLSTLDKLPSDYIRGISKLDDGPMMHALLLLIPAAVLPFLGVVVSSFPLVRSPVNGIDAGSGIPRAMFLVALASLFLSWWASAVFSLVVSGVSKHRARVRAILSAVTVIGLQGVMVWALARGIRGRTVAAGEMLCAAVAGAGVLLLLTAIARGVSRARQAYTVWAEPGIA